MPGGDEYRKLAPGERHRRFPARVYSAMLDAAGDAKAARGPAFETDPADHFRQATVVSVLNDSGAAVPRFGVLGIDGPLTFSAADKTEFNSRPMFRGVTPAADITRRKASTVGGDGLKLPKR